MASVEANKIKIEALEKEVKDMGLGGGKKLQQKRPECIKNLKAASGDMHRVWKIIF